MGLVCGKHHSDRDNAASSSEPNSQPLTPVQLDVEAISQAPTEPLRSDPPHWRATPPVTKAHIAARRREFWMTAPSYSGRQEIWQVLKAACEEPDRDLARVLLETAGVTLAGGHLLTAYDELGNRYDIPIYCSCYPDNVVEDTQRTCSPSSSTPATSTAANSPAATSPAESRFNLDTDATTPTSPSTAQTTSTSPPSSPPPQSPASSSPPLSVIDAEGNLIPIAGEPFNLTVRLSTGEDIVIPSGKDDPIARVLAAVRQQHTFQTKTLSLVVFCGKPVARNVKLSDLGLTKNEVLQLWLFVPKTKQPKPDNNAQQATAPS